MSNMKIVLRSPPSINRRQPLLRRDSSSSRSSVVGEVVGGTAAECVAVCCCFPCGLAFNVLLLALYKVPFGLCRRMIRGIRRRNLAKGRLPLPAARRRIQCKCGCCDASRLRIVEPMCANDDFDVKAVQYSSFVQPDKEVIDLENEMWDRFYGTGFWRSSSRRDSSSNVLTTFQPQYVR
ncbi:hypothetical protein HN51_032960 [Arachis hypogaea]|uniref:Uncharacterized protein n=2 Tax=Arachis TaxID=3817 RepID=A0A445B2N7_ARAHY|nr:uncharacterized protein LOC107471335 [Arachis duranensis]XP_025625663.1 uncharacterized protein LOC112717960 [Arachis hypogaea]RYR32916.1 hypothetical protein Ahy_A10g047438 [Arachis hypogaea]